jgi:uncharacterized CHY-type Zn-finger protein
MGKLGFIEGAIPENTDEGLVICGNCKTVLACISGGDMPEKCPGCEKQIDWTKWIDPWDD